MALLPAVIFTSPELEQVETAVPATAVATAFTVIIRSAKAAHVPPFTVNRNITVPLKFAVGVKVTLPGVVVEPMLLRDPVPENIDQVAPVPPV